MKTYKKHLKESLQDQKFKEIYNEEKELFEIAMKLHENRKKSGKSQYDIAKEAHLTQQQVSRVENGVPCSITTFIKTCHANGFKLDLKPLNTKKRRVAVA